MNKIISKTFGGLSKEYYLRQFLFGLIFPLFFYLMASSGKGSASIQNVDGSSIMNVGTIAFMVISAFLYPYSRYVYESIVGYVMGDNMFITSIPFLFITKFFTMALCWGFAFLIAPIGLLYLYYYHTKEEKI